MKRLSRLWLEALVAAVAFALGFVLYDAWWHSVHDDGAPGSGPEPPYCPDELTFVG